ncbi:MAG: autotransporter strand-loop-strand O-heptosyltransferase [Selenomonadaceae bacterium]|nr:autotransporter strand-loop-strand O-heptosyltransferase [Selenomonadaceae bacterium]
MSKKHSKPKSKPSNKSKELNPNQSPSIQDSKAPLQQTTPEQAQQAPAQPQSINNPYKYPVRFFYGPSLTHIPKDILAKILSYFHSNNLTNSPIIGKINIPGISMDFNFGLRLEIPAGNKYHIKVRDYYNDVGLFDEEIENTTLISAEKLFVHWHVTISQNGNVLFDYKFNPRGQRVHFIFHQALGDNITLFPYMDTFQKAYDCRISCTVPPYLKELVGTYYPHIEQTDTLPYDTYATYYMAACINVPIAANWDSRALPLVDIGRTILADSKIGKVGKVVFKPTQERTIKEPYVCIAVQASTTAKSWMYPGGWDIVINYLKQRGYRVLCIDKERECTNYGNTVTMPAGAEDFTGDIPLMNRVNMLAYADFFIGVGSGLSWVAWSLDIPVIMISGISEPWAEFENPYRVINNMVCHGCFNDLRVDLAECYNCKRYENTNRRFECSKRISPQRVLEKIDQVIADLHK